MATGNYMVLCRCESCTFYWYALWMSQGLFYLPNNWTFSSRLTLSLLCCFKVSLNENKSVVSNKRASYTFYVISRSMLSMLNVCGTYVLLHQIRILVFRLKKTHQTKTYKRGHSKDLISITVVTGRKLSSQSSRLQTEMVAWIVFFTFLHT